MTSLEVFIVGENSWRASLPSALEAFRHSPKGTQARGLGQKASEAKTFFTPVVS